MISHHLYCCHQLTFLASKNRTRQPKTSLHFSSNSWLCGADPKNNPPKHFRVQVFICNKCNKSYFKVAQYNKDKYSGKQGLHSALNITNPGPRIKSKETTTISKYSAWNEFTECKSHLETRNIDWNCFKSEIRQHSPGWCGSVDWAPVCKWKGHQLGSPSGHMPGLQTGSPVRDIRESTHDVSLALFLPLPLSLKINKILKKKKKKERNRTTHA